MAIVRLPDGGQEIPMDDAIAASDEMLKASLAPLLPEVNNATIKRDNINGQMVVTIIKRAGTKGALASPPEAPGTTAPGDDQTLQLRIDALRTDGGTQIRAKMDPAAIAQYAADMEEGDAFPAVMVFRDVEGLFWLADGFQRVEAAKSLGITTIWAQVRRGSRRDAVLYAVGANRTHGVRRTRADARRAVEALLTDEEWRRLSDREIARMAGVTHPFVGDVRRDLYPPPPGSAPRETLARDDEDLGDDDGEPSGLPSERLVTKGNTTYTYHVPVRPEPAKAEVAGEAGEAEVVAQVGTCRECGCTDENACEGGCYWVEDDLCSRCAVVPPLSGEEAANAEPAQTEAVETPANAGADPANAAPRSAPVAPRPAPAKPAPASAAPASVEALPLPWAKTMVTVTLQLFPQNDEGVRMISVTVNAPGVKPIIELGAPDILGELPGQVADALIRLNAAVTERWEAAQPKKEEAAE